MTRQTYESLDAFRLDDGRVMVTLGEPGHRIPEEFVPLADGDKKVVTGLRDALAAMADQRDAALAEVERLRERVKALEALVAATPYRSPDAPLETGRA